jgi:hypothetical protein
MSDNPTNEREHQSKSDEGRNMEPECPKIDGENAIAKISIYYLSIFFLFFFI